MTNCSFADSFKNSISKSIYLSIFISFHCSLYSSINLRASSFFALISSRLSHSQSSTISAIIEIA